MNTDMMLNGEARIVANPAVCHGNPVVRGTRIMVWLILDYLANGDSVDDVLAAYPGLTREDVSACRTMHFAEPRRLGGRPPGVRVSRG